MVYFPYALEKFKGLVRNRVFSTCQRRRHSIVRTLFMWVANHLGGSERRGLALLVVFILCLSTRLDSQNVELQGIEQSEGPGDLAMAAKGKKVSWIPVDNGETKAERKSLDNFLFHENKYEIQLFVPLDAGVQHKDCRVHITQKTLHCGLENGPMFISGELMEPIQTQHSYWEYISEDEYDPVDAVEGINGTHIYIFLVKAYANTPMWEQLYKPMVFLEKMGGGEVAQEDDAAEEVDDSFGGAEDGGDPTAAEKRLPASAEKEKQLIGDYDGDGDEGDADDVSAKIIIDSAVPPPPEVPGTIKLVRRLDVEGIAHHLQDNKDAVHDMDEKGRTALMWLASDYTSAKHRSGEQFEYLSGKIVAICHVLLDAGADPFQADFYGMTALHWASASGWAQLSAVLLAQDEEMEQNMANLRDLQNGSTPLIIAAANGHNEVVGVLLARNAQKNQRENTKAGWTPLMYSAYNGHYLVCETLLHAGAKHDMKDKSNGRTACHLAVSQGKTKAVEIMLGYEACDMQATDATGATPYSIATKIGFKEVARVLRDGQVKSIQKKHEEWMKRTEL